MRNLKFKGNVMEGSLQPGVVVGPNTLGEYLQVTYMHYNEELDRTITILRYWRPDEEVSQD